MTNFEQKSPPKRAVRFLRWFLHSDYVEDIEGDLRERFEENQTQLGPKPARKQFWIDVLFLFRPSLTKSFSLDQFLIQINVIVFF